MNAHQTVLVSLALAGAAQAQPVLDYTVLGSISSEWTDKPWPNIHYTPGDNRWLLFDFAGDGGVMLGDYVNSWIFRGGSAVPVREFQQQVPGLAAGVRWSSAAPALSAPRLIPGPLYTMVNAAISQSPQSIHATAGGFERTPFTFGTGASGAALVSTASSGWGIGHDGVIDEVIPGATGPFTWYPSWQVYGGLGGAFPIGLGPDGRAWGVAQRFDPFPWAYFLFVADPATHSARILAVEGDPAPPLGTLSTIEHRSPVFAGVADDGTVLIEALVRNPSGVTTGGHYAVSDAGLWEAVFPNSTDLPILPAGVQFREYNSEAVTLNRHAQAAGLKQVTGAGVTDANDTVIVTWDRAGGPRLVAREGDQVPGEPAGVVFGHFEAIYLSAHGDLAFEDAAALYLYHPLAGMATVARTGRPVADGLATDLPPTRITTSYHQVTRTRTQAIRGAATYIDDDGVVYFYAHATPHYVAYSARIHPRCPADFNGDDFADFFDYADFVGCFETGVCPPGRTADFNGDGFADFFDYADFVTAFESGC